MANTVRLFRVWSQKILSAPADIFCCIPMSEKQGVYKAYCWDAEKSGYWLFGEWDARIQLFKDYINSFCADKSYLAEEIDDV